MTVGKSCDLSHPNNVATPLDTSWGPEIEYTTSSAALLPQDDGNNNCTDVSYMTKINQIHRTIKFTYELNQRELTFLDVTLYKGDRFNHNHILDIRTHIKSTNTQVYVQATSYHPPKTISAISKGETNRYLRTNSDEREFKNMKQKLTTRLLQRGYKYKQILPHIESVKTTHIQANTQV